MTAIYDKIKRGNLGEGKKILFTVAETLIDRGSELIICGCTEASLVLKHGYLPVPICDPLQILAEAAVAAALGQ
jgi:aspartate racemase